MKIRKISTTVTIFVLAVSLAANSIVAGVLLLLYAFGEIENIVTVSIVFVFISMLSSTLAGVLLAIPFSKYILRPVENLREAMEKVSKGDYNARIRPSKYKITDNTTVGKLVQSFNNMARELSNTELFRNDFITDFSHEFKTPISSIRGIAKQLYSGKIPEEERNDYLKIIYDESERLAKLSDEILLMSRLEKQEIITEKTKYRLDEQLRMCILLFETKWSAKNLEIDMDLDKIEYCQNKALIEHIWNNLFTNAIKFTPEYGRIAVSAVKEDGYVKVSVSDTGIGMDEETLRHVFDKFYQGDTSHTTAGNGLGLALVKRILDMIGGKIEVESRPDFGSVFTVYLPEADQ